MCVSGSTSSSPRSMTSSITSRPTIDSSASVTAAPHGDIFSLSEPGQVAEVLAAHRVDRTEHDHPVVRAPFEHRLEPGREREHALARARAAAEAHDADLVVEQDVDGDVLLGRPTAEVEHRLVGAHEVQPLVGVHAGERRLRTRVERDAGVARRGRVRPRGRRPCARRARRSPSSTRRARRSRSSRSRWRARCGTRRPRVPTTPALRRSGQVLGDDDDVATLATQARRPPPGCGGRWPAT